MGQISSKLRSVEGELSHWCPGCEEMHILPNTWNFDGNLEYPTFSPSFKHSGIKTEKINGIWTGEWIKDQNGNFVPFICHYILTSGILNFCNDSTHIFAGKSLPLPLLPEQFID